MDPKIEFLNERKLPVILNNTERDFDLVDWASGKKNTIRAFLSEYGAILFRGYSIFSIEDFENFAQAATSANWVEYLEATSPRDHVKSNTYTSTKYNSHRTIFFHNEKSYAAEWPLYVFFYCDVPSQIGGETPLSDCRAIYKDLPQDILQKFQEKKLLYVRQFSNNMGIPWKKAFNVESESELEKYCHENHIEDLSWKSDGTPVLKYVRDTVILHPLTFDKCWFNHGTFFNAHSLEPEIKSFFLSKFGKEGLPYNTYYGNGEEIEEEVIHLLRELYEKHSTSFKWEQNDVLLVDNLLVAHGRRPFEGERKILVAMTEPLNLLETISS